MRTVGLCAVTFTMAMYAPERRGPVLVLLFALGCMLSNAYGFLSGAWSFGVVELMCVGRGRAALAGLAGRVRFGSGQVLRT